MRWPAPATSSSTRRSRGRAAITLTLTAYKTASPSTPPITIQGRGRAQHDGGQHAGAHQCATDLVSAPAQRAVHRHAEPTGRRSSSNGQGYTLLYNMSDVQGSMPTATGLARFYALAKPLDAWRWSRAGRPIGTDGVGNINGQRRQRVRRRVQGLGNTISNLTINLPSANYVGLFGYVGSGSIRTSDWSAAMSTGGDFTGGLVGYNSAGTISRSYSTGQCKVGRPVASWHE